MKFWTTEVIGDTDKIYMLFEENENPRVGRQKDTT